jgi:hypothetical protein
MFHIVLLAFLIQLPRASTAESTHNATQEVTRDKFYRDCSEDFELKELKSETSLFCSPWMYCDSGACRCGEIPNSIMRCSENKNLSVLDFNCVTYNEDKELFEAGSCMYYQYPARFTIHDSYHTLPQTSSDFNNFLCGKEFNRTGTLCGACKDGYYPLAYSFDMNCIHCPRAKTNWWKFVMVSFLPLTIIYFLLLFLKINITSSHFRTFVFYSQMVSAPVATRTFLLDSRSNISAQTIARYISALYGTWNLDILRSLDLKICLEISTLQTLGLELAVGIYPFLLMISTYLLVLLRDRNFKPLVMILRPFKAVSAFLQRNWEIKTSLIDAFAAFILLLNFKFMSVAFDLLAPVRVYQLSPTGNLSYTWRLYYDANIPYLGAKHLPYALPAIAAALVFGVVPPLLLIIYPFRWFQKLLNTIPVRWYILHTFVDSFQGCYKDGMESGTSDHRRFASILFIMPSVFSLLAGLTFNIMYFSFAALVLVIIAILYMIVQPFKKNFSHYTPVTAVFLILLSLWYTSLLGMSIAEMYGPRMILLFWIIIGMVGLLPIVYCAAIILHWVYTNRRFGWHALMRLRAWRRGYETLH